MKKIPCIYMIDRVTHVMTLEHNPETAWVWHLPRDWTATRKYDGTACAVINGQFYKRRCVKPNKPVPELFIECSHDLTTGRTFGWIPITLGMENIHHWEGHDTFCNTIGIPTRGTYELIGPSINGNPEEEPVHTLVPHGGSRKYTDVPIHSAQLLRKWLAQRDIEGLVFKHEDGRMAKIRKKDFGLRRKP